MKNIRFVKEIHSTNSFLKELLQNDPLPEKSVVYTDFQTAGRGQSGNSWESEKGKNLLFSLLLYPHHILIENQFILSQIVSIAIKKTLDNYTDHITIKWPNDIYWNDRKLGGILIENSIQGGKLKSMVVGVGLNVNQKTFTSDAPNPVSLLQIIGKRINRKKLLTEIIKNIGEQYTNSDSNEIKKLYFKYLYRNIGFHNYQSENERFSAKIISILPNGCLELETEQGEQKKFYFKEVQFC